MRHKGGPTPSGKDAGPDDLAAARLLNRVQSTRVVDAARSLDLIGTPEFLAGYASGYAHGLEAGRTKADEEAAALHRRATHIVHAIADIPTHDELERRRRDYSGRWSA